MPAMLDIPHAPPSNGTMDVKTAGRTVDLFEVFARARAPMTLSEIARALGAPQSSCFNLIRSLEARGYLYSVGGNKRLYPTRKLFDIAGAIAGYEPVLPRVEPLLERLRDESGETVIFAARQGDRVIYLSVVEGKQTIRYISRAGELKPMHASAAGKALLMQMAPAERARLVARLSLKQVTGNTVTAVDTLLDEIDVSERRGYAMTKGENVVDVMAVARPLMIESVAYAIAVAGPIQRLENDPARYAAQIERVVGQLT